jgi:hypothetical protein
MWHALGGGLVVAFFLIQFYRFAKAVFDGARTVWLPKSQCEWDSDTSTMTMPEWLAKEKELI